MYAIVMTGGKQYKVAKDDVIRVEKIDAEENAVVELPVIMVSDDGKVKCGNPIANAVVKAIVVAQDKTKKVVVYKYKSKKNVRSRQGHRQPFTALKITEIKA